MIDYILASPVATESGEALADCITQRQGGLCRITQYGRVTGRVVRYGSKLAADGQCLNSLDSVRRASNKLGALITMEEAGLPVPRLDWGGEAKPWPRLCRKMYRHAGSDAPHMLPAGVPVPEQYDYSLEYIDKLAEYRIHVCCGEVIRTQIKRRRRHSEHHPYIWTLENGWVLMETTAPFGYLPWLGVKAVAALGLDFGAVDIVHGRWGLYILEVNTAPGILPEGVGKYAKAFMKWDMEEAVCK